MGTVAVGLARLRADKSASMLRTRSACTAHMLSKPVLLVID